MSVGGVSMGMYLKAIPAGLTFTVTEFKTSRNGRSYDSFSCPTLYHARDTAKAAFDIEPSHDEGQVVKCLHSSTRAFGKNSTMSSTLRFRIHGISQGRQIDKGGTFKFSTTEWGWMARPGYALLIFQFDGGDAQQVSQSIPTLITPDPFYFAVAQQGGRLAVVASNENNLSSTILSDVLDGILTSHSRALSWVIGL